MKLCHMNWQLYHFSVIIFLDLFSAWREFDSNIPFAPHCTPIVTDVGGAVNNTGVQIWTRDGGFWKKQLKINKK